MPHMASPCSVPCQGKAVLCTTKKPAELQTLRNNPSKSFIVT